MFIRQIIYRSTPTRPLSDQELKILVGKSHARNAARGITSFLYYAQSCYLHVLEGEDQAVEELHAALGQDDRHANMVTMVDTAVTKRLFPDISMGKCCLPPTSLDRLASYLDPKHRSALLPSSCDAQDVIRDLLHEFVTEPSRPDQEKG